MTARCPANAAHAQFVTTVHEVHDWVVDAKGEFEEDLGCIETVHGPCEGNNWTCFSCGADAIVSP